MCGQVASSARPWLVGAVLLATCVWAIDLGLLRAGVPHPLDDTWEYGVAARELLAGHGFRTAVLHPPLWTLRDQDLTVPVLIHGPVLPLLVAPLLAVAGPAALGALAWIAALFATLTATTLFRLGARRGGVAVGAAAAGAWSLSPLTLHAVNHDPALPIGAFLLALALERLLLPAPRGLAAGLALGLGCLVRPELLLATPPMLLLAGPAWRSCGLAILACLLPWWWHNLRATGSPLFNLSSYLVIGYSEHRPGISVLRDFELPPRAFPAALRASLPWLPHKWIGFLPRALAHAAVAPSVATGWLVIPALVQAWRARPAERRLGACALGMALIPVLVMTLTVHDPRYLTPFLPLWALGVALGAQSLSRFLPGTGHPRVWLGLLLLLLLPWFALALNREAHEARGLERRIAAESAALQARGRRSGAPPRPMFSDTPDFVAWTTGRPTLWVTREEYRRLPPCEGGPRRPPAGALPCRGGAEDTWFHASP